MAVVTSINLVMQGPAVHVTVEDQDGNLLSPSYIAWDAVPFASTVTITPDATGFNFAVSGTNSTSIQTKATYSGPGVNSALAGPELTINIAAPAPPPVTVTSLQYTSP